MPSKSLILPFARSRSMPDDSAARRVLVAIGLHSDEQGLTCRVPDDVLADSASVSPEELADALRSLADAGWIRTLLPPAGAPRARRVIVLMDHDAAGRYVRRAYASIRAVLHPSR